MMMVKRKKLLGVNLIKAGREKSKQKRAQKKVLEEGCKMKAKLSKAEKQVLEKVLAILDVNPCHQN